MKKAKKAEPVADQVIGLFGDLIFDYLEFLLGSASSAMLALKPWLESIRVSPGPFAAAQAEGDERLRTLAFERASQVARPIYEKLFHFGHSGSAHSGTGPAEKATTPLLESLARLRFEERASIILRDRYRLPLHEISSILRVPEDSIKLARGKALQSLAEASR